VAINVIGWLGLPRFVFSGISGRISRKCPPKLKLAWLTVGARILRILRIFRFPPFDPNSSEVILFEWNVQFLHFFILIIPRSQDIFIISRIISKKSQFFNQNNNPTWSRLGEIIIYTATNKIKASPPKKMASFLFLYKILINYGTLPWDDRKTKKVPHEVSRNSKNCIFSAEI